MSTHAYTEDQLVEQPAIGLFAELGWTIAFGNLHPDPLPEGEGVSGVGLLPSTDGRGVGDEGAALMAPLLGRETTGEVVLKPRLEAALRRLNPALPPEAITAAVDDLTRDRSAMGLPAANREVYLDASITGVNMPTKPAPVLDLSKLDFGALGKRFKQSKTRKTDLEVLKAAIRAQLDRMIRLNRTRTDFQEKFEQLIESYNAGSRNIEELYNELLTLSRALTDEQQRHVRENLTEEELVVLDILTRPGPDLSSAERNEVKKVARQLLAQVQALLVLDWRRRSDARARVRLAIEDALDAGLPRAYTPALYEGKCSALFTHVYENYYGEGAGIYAQAS